MSRSVPEGTSSSDAPGTGAVSKVYRPKPDDVRLSNLVISSNSNVQPGANCAEEVTPWKAAGMIRVSAALANGVLMIWSPALICT